jgi:hypothetical protein
VSLLFPSCRDAYITGIGANGNTITFTIRASDEQVITEITTRLNKSGYDVKPGRQNKGRDGAYPHSIDVTMTPELGRQINFDNIYAQTRPADDIGTRSPTAAAPTPTPAPTPAPVVSNSGGAPSGSSGNSGSGTSGSPGSRGPTFGSSDGSDRSAAWRDPNFRRRFGSRDGSRDGSRGGER